MIRIFLRRFGTIRVMLAFTLVSVLTSVLITMLINRLISGNPLEGGLLVAILIPAGITPMLSYHNLKLVEQLDKAEEQLQILSITDDLTQVYNRRYFMEVGTREFEKARRYQQCFAIAIMDLDNFKEINDNYGHLAGNHVLAEFCRECRLQIRSSDTMARYGGDEFIFLLPHRDISNVMEAAERIQNVLISTPVVYENNTFQLKASIGLSLFKPGDTNLDEMLRRADKALYAVKHRGGNFCKLDE
jgi:diguanylate cyclase (GGDEF)-like protein